MRQWIKRLWNRWECFDARDGIGTAHVPGRDGLTTRPIRRKIGDNVSQYNFATYNKHHSQSKEGIPMIIACLCGGILESAVILGSAATVTTGFGAIVAWCANRRQNRVNGPWIDPLDRLEEIINLGRERAHAEFWQTLGDPIRVESV